MTVPAMGAATPPPVASSPTSPPASTSTATAIRRLVAGNWVRTAAWTARAWVALALLAEAAR